MGCLGKGEFGLICFMTLFAWPGMIVDWVIRKTTRTTYFQSIKFILLVSGLFYFLLFLVLRNFLT